MERDRKEESGRENQRERERERKRKEWKIGERGKKEWNVKVDIVVWKVENNYVTKGEWEREWLTNTSLFLKHNIHFHLFSNLPML